MIYSESLRQLVAKLGAPLNPQFTLAGWFRKYNRLQQKALWGRYKKELPLEMFTGHSLGFFFFLFVSLPFKMIWDKSGLRGCWRSPQDIETSGCFWKSGGCGELWCVYGGGGLAPVSPAGQQSWSPLILYKGVLWHWRGSQPGGLKRRSLLPATLPAWCGTGECGQQPLGPLLLSSSLVSGSFTPPLLPPTPSLARGTSKLDRKPNATEGSLLMDIYFRLFVVEKCETMWMSNNIEVIG